VTRKVLTIPIDSQNNGDGDIFISFLPLFEGVKGVRLDVFLSGYKVF
jgi:hypothetical protein